MTKDERLNLYKRAIEKWGETSQLDQLIEEMGELIVAVNKFKRTSLDLKHKRAEILENLYEEIADVKMCLEQMEYIFGEENIERLLEQKLQKFLGQLNK